MHAGDTAVTNDSMRSVSGQSRSLAPNRSPRNAADRHPRTPGNNTVGRVRNRFGYPPAPALAGAHVWDIGPDSLRRSPQRRACRSCEPSARVMSGPSSQSAPTRAQNCPRGRRRWRGRCCSPASAIGSPPSVSVLATRRHVNGRSATPSRGAPNCSRAPSASAFARLSVFAGGSTLDAAEAVAETNTDTIEVLVDSSLLHRVTVTGTARLTMLETIREHAAALLDDAERVRAEDAHIAYYRSFAARLAFDGPSVVNELATVDADLDNLRVAFDRSSAAGDDEDAFAIAVDLGRYWHIRGHYREGSERIRQRLERGAGEPARRAQAMGTLSYLTYLRGELADAVDLATRGAEAATSTQSLDALCRCHTVLGLVALDRDQFTTARDHLERAHAIAVDFDRDTLTARTNGNLADLAMMCGDHEQARQRWKHSLTRPLTPWREVHARWGLGTAARRDGRVDEADDHFTRALQLAEAIGYPHYVAIALVGLAVVAADRGEHVQCSVLLERVDAVLQVAGIELTGIDAEAYLEAKQATLATTEPGEPVPGPHEPPRPLADPSQR